MLPAPLGVGFRIVGRLDPPELVNVPATRRGCAVYRTDLALSNRPEIGELAGVGAYRWGGFWYTTFFIDPAEKMAGVCMARLYPAGRATLNDQFEALAHQAIVAPR